MFAVRLRILISFALLVQALVPAGWMPARATKGITIALCSGRMPAANDPAVQAARKLLDAALADIPSGDDEDGADQRCAFSTPPPAVQVPGGPVVILPVFEPSRPIPASYTAVIGQRLPAPPPPSTGPPFTS